MKGIKLTFGILGSLLFASLLLGCSAKEPAYEYREFSEYRELGSPKSAGAPSAVSRTVSYQSTEQYTYEQPQKSKTSSSSKTAPAPAAVEHPLVGQYVDQAAEHWRDMASEVADRVLKAYRDRSDLMDRPIYLPEPNNRPFTVAFYHLLRSELVSRGLQVSYKQEPRSTVLEYTVQTVPFDSSRHAQAKKYSKVTPSKHEIILNARLHYRNRFVMHASAVRYINDADLALYVDPQASDPMASGSRNIRITRK